MPFDPKINIEAIHAHAAELAKEAPLSTLFNIKTANDWLSLASSKPIPNQLFKEFWYESEVCILFADTNVGKSILAVQIGNQITQGLSEAAAQKVLYFDFELSEKQFENRYSEDYKYHYQFSEFFFRVEIDTDSDQPDRFETYEDWLDHSLEMAVVETEAQILIVDNITYLRDETEKGNTASRLMKLLKNLKKKYQLSILVLAHTPKRDMTKPLSRNDLGGSKRLIDFCDSSFAIGESFKDKGLRYIKQIKVRNGPHVYDTENVLVCEIIKHNSFLKFESIGLASEREHLKTLTEEDRGNLASQVQSLKHLSQRQIANKLGISLGSVNKYLKMDDVPNFIGGKKTD